MLKLAYTKNGKEYSHTLGDVSEELELLSAKSSLPVASIEYLLQYGFAQSLQDAHAQPASAAKKSGDDMGAAIDGAIMKRVGKIVAGTMATSDGIGRIRSAFDAVTRDVLDARLVAWAIEKKVKLPTKNADLEPYRVKYMAKHADSVKAEVATRSESPVAAITVDLAEF